MPKLESLTVRGYKSILELEDFEVRSLNVLIGANGAGKSNFISLFRMLANLIDKKLQLFVKEQGGPNSLLFGGSKRTSRLDVGLLFGDKGYYFSLIPAARGFAFANEGVVFPNIREQSLPGLFDAELPDSASFAPFDQEGRLACWFGSGHEEALLPDIKEDYFRPYILPVITSWRVYHFHDTSTTAPIRQLQAVRDNILLKCGGDNLGPFLRYLLEHYPDNYQQIIEAVRLAAPFFGDMVYRRDSGERMELEWFQADDPDTVLGPRQLSDGTLRFICLATLLLQPTQLQPELILIDEPELGLHPYALTLLAEMLQQASDTKQLIVSTQSADLVSELAPDDVVVVNRKDEASTFERLDEDDLNDWLEDYSLGELWKMNIFGGRLAG